MRSFDDEAAPFGADCESLGEGTLLEVGESLADLLTRENIRGLSPSLWELPEGAWLPYVVWSSLEQGNRPVRSLELSDGVNHPGFRGGSVVWFQNTPLGDAAAA